MSVFRFFALFLAILVSVCGVIGSTTAAAGSSNNQAPYDTTSTSQPKKDNTPKVVQLTSRDFDSSVKDGSIWLVEFYAPWCGHCTKFAPTYEEIGRVLHEQTSTQKRPVKVAKINGDKEKSIMNRFQITGFPSFYVIDGWNVYLYDGSRAVSEMVEWAKGGYKRKSEPIPFLSSPLGPIGQLQGYLMRAGSFVMDIFDWLTIEKGLSPLAAGGVFCAGCIALSFFSMIALIVLMTPKLKND